MFVSLKLYVGFFIFDSVLFLLKILFLFNKMYEEAVAQTCSVKRVFLEISQNSQENTCARVSFLIKLQAPPATLLNRTPLVAASVCYCLIVYSFSIVTELIINFCLHSLARRLQDQGDL